MISKTFINYNKNFKMYNINQMETTVMESVNITNFEDELSQIIQKLYNGNINLEILNSVSDSLNKLSLGVENMIDRYYGELRFDISNVNKDLVLYSQIEGETNKEEYINTMKNSTARTCNIKNKLDKYFNIKKNIDNELRQLNSQLLIIIRSQTIVSSSFENGENDESDSMTSSNTCKFSCDYCHIQNNPIDFCLSGNCLECDAKMASERQYKREKVKKEYLAHLRLGDDKNAVGINTDSENFDSNNDSFSSEIIPDDQYYKVMITADKDDGSIEYISKELLRNYNKMMPSCAMMKANTYAVTVNGLGVPVLNGLIRYNGLPKPFSMCPSSAIFSNIIKNEKSNKKNKRPKTIQKLTINIGKNKGTKTEDIKSAWKFIDDMKDKNGTISADIQDLKQFL